MATYRHGKKKYYKKYRKSSGTKSNRKAYKKFKKRVKRVIFSTCEKYKLVYATGATFYNSPTQNWYSSPTVTTNQIKWMCLPALVTQGVGGSDYMFYQNYFLSSNTDPDRFQTTNAAWQMIKGKEFYLGTIDIRIKFCYELVSTTANTSQLTLVAPYTSIDSGLCPTAMFMVVQAAKGITDDDLEAHLAATQYAFMSPTNPAFVKVLKRTDFRLTNSSPTYSIHWKFNKKPKRYQLGNQADAQNMWTFAKQGKFYLYYACYNVTATAIANTAGVCNPNGYIRSTIYDNN